MPWLPKCRSLWPSIRWISPLPIPELVKTPAFGDLGLVPDEWDGDTIMVPVSAKKKDGLDDLMEAILSGGGKQSRFEANPNGKVLGTVVEAELDKSRGVMATLFLQNGTIKTG